MPEHEGAPQAWLGEEVTIYRMDGGRADAFTLMEVSELGILAERGDQQRFLPWTSISEIHKGDTKPNPRARFVR